MRRMTEAPAPGAPAPGAPAPSAFVAAPSPWILLAVIVASGIVFLDSTIVTVALPRIGQDLPSTTMGTLEAQAYITSGYLAVLSAFLILGGAMADRYGRRRIFSAGLVGFGVTSLLCGLAPTMELLVVARLLQGASGALLVPGSLTIITASYEGEAARPGVRHLGRRHLRADRAGAARRRPDRGPVLVARGVPGERAAHRPRAVGHAPPRARDTR